MLEGPWFGTAAFLALALLLASAVFSIEAALLAALRRSAQQTKATWDDALTKALQPGLPLAAALLAFAAAVQASGAHLEPAAHAWANAATLAVVAFLAALALSRFVTAAVARHVMRHPQRRAMGDVVRRTASWAAYVVAGLVLLDSLGVRITPLLASLGIGGIALALALQDSLSNYFAGLWMRSTREIRPGHYIRVQDGGQEGHLVAIGWRTTRMRTPDNNLVILPNSFLSKTVVTNYSLPEGRVSLSIPVQVSYESDPDQVTGILVEETLAVASDALGLLREPAPFVEMAPGFGEKGLQLTLVCQVRDISHRRAVQDAVRRRILARFRREGIRIATG
jgi:small-conductance mechanosensitive channel